MRRSGYRRLTPSGSGLQVLFEKIWVFYRLDSATTMYRHDRLRGQSSLAPQARYINNPVGVIYRGCLRQYATTFGVEHSMRRSGYSYLTPSGSGLQVLFEKIWVFYRLDSASTRYSHDPSGVRASVVFPIHMGFYRLDSPTTRYRDDPNGVKHL